MLLEDLKRLCAILQARQFRCQGGVVYMPSTMKGSPDLRVSTRDAFSPSVLTELRSTKYRVVDEKVQATLLAPLKGLIADSQKVSISGNVPYIAGADHVKSIMRPGIVCTEAKKWALYEVAIRLKAFCDETLSCGKYKAAAQAYNCLIDDLERVMHEPFFPTAALEHSTDADYAMEVLLIDLCLHRMAWTA